MTKFSRPECLSNSNIYEVNLRQFTPEGTIHAFSIHLPRLQDMGVDILWMMPIHPIGKLKRKGSLGSYYSISDYLDINPEFGSKEDFRKLVTAAHGYGMKIIIDWVANHTAWDNVWTRSNPEFFVKDADGNFKPPFDWDDVLQIDHTSIAEQQAMMNAMEYWITEFDIDGFRADLAHLTPLPFWIQARERLDRLKKNLVWLAETEDISYYQAFDIMYAWKWMHTTAHFVKHNGNVQMLTDLLKVQQHELPEGAMQLYFTSNHDENSWNGTEYEKYGIYAKALAVFNYTYANSVPLVYSGQENPVLKRLKFFDKDPIEWNEQPELHHFYKTLNQFHRDSFSGGEINFLHLHNNVLSFSRKKDEQEILVFLNLDRIRVTVTVHDGDHSQYRNIFSGQVLSVAAHSSIELDPGGYLVLSKLL
ncbi:MAG: alpha-glucosidase C-terminal domain-containing protein [Bacteroidetes bacterium]|nr:alpha-glucosidase C-terminal domain-containing protein [Bacteroidota bacterium]